MNKKHDLITVSVKKLCYLPVMTRVISKKLVSDMSTSVRSKKATIHPILAGRIGSDIYPINDFETVMGLADAGIQNVRVMITDYNSMNDLLADHVESNFHPHMIDPLKIQQVVDYLVTNSNMKISDACKVLLLDRRPELRNVVHAKITKDARMILLDMIEEISQRLYCAVTPTYYITKLAKITPEEQHDAALEIKACTMPRMLSDEKAAWPSTNMIDTILESFHSTSKISPTEDRVSQPGSVKELGKKHSKNDSKAKDGKTVDDAANYISTDPNLYYVPINADHPDLLVNKKTGRVAFAQEANSIYSIIDDLGKYTHVLPNWASEYLDLDDNSASTTVAKYPSMEKASRALAKAKDPKNRCVVIFVKRRSRK